MAEKISFSQQDNDEENYAAKIIADQTLRQAENNIEAIYKESGAYRHPSYLKYAILFFLAGIIDLVDLLDVTGIGIVISKIVSFFLSALILLIFWLTNTKMNQAQEFTDGLDEKISHIQKNIVYASRLAMKTSKILRKVGMKRTARAIPRTMVRLRRLARKNPMTKVAIGGLINLIPFLAIFNLMVVWIYISYRDEKKTYRQAREAGEEALSQVELPITA